MIPYSYLQANPETNWVASCQICNGIKGDRMFDTPEDVCEYVNRRRTRLGWGPVDGLTAEFGEADG
jgi:hypothetical protein